MEDIFSFYLPVGRFIRLSYYFTQVRTRTNRSDLLVIRLLKGSDRRHIPAEKGW